MSEDDLAYFARRAEEELEQAQRATSAEAVRIHYALATYYVDMIEEARPTLTTRQ